MKEMFLNVSKHSQENTFVKVSFLIELETLSLQMYQKRDSDIFFYVRFHNIFQALLLFDSIYNEHKPSLINLMNNYFVKGSFIRNPAL